MKKIIGYLAPSDLFSGNVKKGAIFTPFNEFDLYSTRGSNHPEGYFSLPKEIVESWEPVYKENIWERNNNWIRMHKPVEGKVWTEADSPVKIENNAGMNLDDDQDRTIAEFLIPLGFITYIKGRNLFIHPSIPYTIFDLSASGKQPLSIMRHIFDEVIKVGELKKQNEIKTVLGL